MFLWLAKGVTNINRLIGKFFSWLIIPIFLLLLADVVMRYLVGRPAIWTSELATMTFSIYAIVGGGFLLVERAHVNVDIFYGNYSVKRKALIDILTWVLFLLFVGVLMSEGWALASDSISQWERSQSVWHPYIWPIKLGIPISAMLLFLQGVVRLWSDFRVLMDLPVDEETFGKLGNSEKKS